ncbi:hypothetical protein RB623_20055 [Mesorhizobium sp. LHD-90]|uniref:hypothetical protein n=1 Tax=Mesorhizobium sp. LHD-90 TaxID=3071414 RepID=UPI0027DEF333|nr:hypothetical protein [Mesorhizobium sp. LHD-90]MDQ6436357.1 hypothetical protein [Mesorhizobium sp. LHD-90]
MSARQPALAVFEAQARAELQPAINDAVAVIRTRLDEAAAALSDEGQVGKSAQPTRLLDIWQSAAPVWIFIPSAASSQRR